MDERTMDLPPCLVTTVESEYFTAGRLRNVTKG
jgi:hypothetical protein